MHVSRKCGTWISVLLAVGGVSAVYGQPAFGPWTQDGYDQQRTARSHLVGPRGTPVVRWAAQISNSANVYPAVGPDGTLFTGAPVPAGPRLVAVSPLDGSILWEYLMRQPIEYTPAIGADGKIYVHAGNSRWITAVSSSGQMVWEYLPDVAPRSNPLIRDDNSVIFATEQSNQMSYVIAVDGDTGQEVWTTSFSPARRTSNPILDLDGRVIVTCAEAEPYIVGFAPDGQLLWTYSLLTLSAGARGSIGADGLGYFFDNRGRMAALLTDSGTAVWRFDIGDPIFYPPAVQTDGRLIVSDSSGVVRAVSTAGSVLWESDFGVAGKAGVSIDAEGVIYFTVDDLLLAITPDGQELWRLQIPNLFASDVTPVIGGPGRLYVVDRSGMLYAIEGEPECDACDVNCDADINAFDIEPFVELLLGGRNPCDDCSGDINGDGVVDAFDIEPFVGCLTP